jgi:hypothetical protein
MGCTGSKVENKKMKRLSAISMQSMDPGMEDEMMLGMMDMATMRCLEEILAAIKEVSGGRVKKVASLYRSRSGVRTRIVQTLDYSTNEENDCEIGLSSEDNVKDAEERKCRGLGNNDLVGREIDFRKLGSNVPGVVETDISDLMSTLLEGRYTVCCLLSGTGVHKESIKRLVRLVTRNIVDTVRSGRGVRDEPILSLLSRQNTETRIIWKTSGWSKLLGDSPAFWGLLDIEQGGLGNVGEDPTEVMIRKVFDGSGINLPMVHRHRVEDEKENRIILSVQMLPLLEESEMVLILCQVHAILDMELEELRKKSLDVQNFDKPAHGVQMKDSLFDKIQLGTLIGKGGYGSVYRCILDGELVALKVLESADRNETTTSMQRHSCSKVVGEQEIEVGTKLNHKNVIRTIDFATRTVEGREQTWIVLEYCESGSLRQLIEDLYFDDQRKVLRVAQEIATGMAYLHSRQVLHGDLSSNNVIFDRDHVAKISDFGLSREFSGATVVTSALGTTSYMAPELLTSGKLNKASDVYSFGILLLEMLTGKRAFSGMRYVEVITNKLADESGLLFENIPSDAPQMLKRLILDCTRMDYKTRPTFDEIVSQFV